MSQWKTAKQFLRISHPSQSSGGRKIGVDAEKEIIYGAVMAQRGPFKSEDRGEFDDASLSEILRLAAASPNGLKARLAHPDLSNDGIGKLLGRWKDPYMDSVSTRESEGVLKTDAIPCVRADLHIDPSSHDTPSGDIGKYVLTVVGSDPDAVSSSLVLQSDMEYRIDAKGLPLRDEEGERLPPLWRPKQLHACDIVDTGDAVDGLLSAHLSADGLPDGVVRKAAELMDRQFAGKDRVWVEGKCMGWLGRYLDRTYGLQVEVGDGRQLKDILAILRAQHWLYHTLHWQTSGPTFYGQHLLFERLYSAIPDQYDGLAEKIVGLFGVAAVDPVSTMRLAFGYLTTWYGPDYVASALSAESVLSEGIAGALAAVGENAGMANFLQGLADSHQTHVYLLQQVQGGKTATDSLAGAPPLAPSILALPADAPEDPPARHDGCRSAKGLHYQKECRQCGSIIDSCGCKDRLREGRLVRMGTCAKCSTPDTPPDAPQGPTADMPQPDDPVVDQAAQRDRRRELMLLELDTEEPAS
jgi:DNA-binding ferritin-like protein